MPNNVLHFQVTINVVDAKEEIINGNYDENNEYLVGYAINQLKNPLQVYHLT